MIATSAPAVSPTPTRATTRRRRPSRTSPDWRHDDRVVRTRPMKTYGFRSVDEARSMLAKLGAPPRLVRHTVLVGEAAELLVDAMTKLGVPVDAHFVRLGVVFHDAGKIQHPRSSPAPAASTSPLGRRSFSRPASTRRSPAAACLTLGGRIWKVSFEELLVASRRYAMEGEAERGTGEAESSRVRRRVSVARSSGPSPSPLDLTQFPRRNRGRGPGRLARSVEG